MSPLSVNMPWLIFRKGEAMGMGMDLKAMKLNLLHDEK
jgi:hypothetical protein